MIFFEVARYVALLLVLLATGAAQTTDGDQATSRFEALKARRAKILAEQRAEGPNHSPAQVEAKPSAVTVLESIPAPPAGFPIKEIDATSEPPAQPATPIKLQPDSPVKDSIDKSEQLRISTLTVSPGVVTSDHNTLDGATDVAAKSLGGATSTSAAKLSASELPSERSAPLFEPPSTTRFEHSSARSARMMANKARDTTAYAASHRAVKNDHAHDPAASGAVTSQGALPASGSKGKAEDDKFESLAACDEGFALERHDDDVARGDVCVRTEGAQRGGEIFVHGLPSNENVYELLVSLFEPIGPVLDVDLRSTRHPHRVKVLATVDPKGNSSTSKHSLGLLAVVRFESKSLAEDAVRRYDHAEVRGGTISVSLSAPNFESHRCPLDCHHTPEAPYCATEAHRPCPVWTDLERHDEHGNFHGDVCRHRNAHYTCPWGCFHKLASPFCSIGLNSSKPCRANFWVSRSGDDRGARRTHMNGLDKLVLGNGSTIAVSTPLPHQACRSKLCRKALFDNSRNGTELVKLLETFGCSSTNASSSCPHLSHTDSKIDTEYVVKFPCDVWEVTAGVRSEFVIHRSARQKTTFTEEGCEAGAQTLIVMFRSLNAVFAGRTIVETQEQTKVRFRPIDPGVYAVEVAVIRVNEVSGTQTVRKAGGGGPWVLWVRSEHDAKLAAVQPPEQVIRHPRAPCAYGQYLHHHDADNGHGRWLRCTPSSAAACPRDGWMWTPATCFFPVQQWAASNHADPHPWVVLVGSTALRGLMLAAVDVAGDGAIRKELLGDSGKASTCATKAWVDLPLRHQGLRLSYQELRHHAAMEDSDDGRAYHAKCFARFRQLLENHADIVIAEVTSGRHKTETVQKYVMDVLGLAKEYPKWHGRFVFVLKLPDFARGIEASTFTSCGPSCDLSNAAGWCSEQTYGDLIEATIARSGVQEGKAVVLDDLSLMAWGFAFDNERGLSSKILSLNWHHHVAASSNVHRGQPFSSMVASPSAHHQSHNHDAKYQGGSRLIRGAVAEIAADIMLNLASLLIDEPLSGKYPRHPELSAPALRRWRKFERSKDACVLTSDDGPRTKKVKMGWPTVSFALVIFVALIAAIYLKRKEEQRLKEEAAVSDAELRERAAQITKQVERMDYVTNQLDARGLVIEEWHALADLKMYYQEAFKKYEAGNQSVEEELMKWGALLDAHPEHIKELDLAAEEWAKKQLPLCREAARQMRTFVPTDIADHGSEALVAKGLPRLLAERLRNMKILWLIVTHPADTVKLHHVDLMNKYSAMGCDITELRAVFASIPESFNNDPDGKKQGWRTSIRDKLKEYTKKEEAGTLMANEKRHRAYPKPAKVAKARGLFSAFSRSAEKEEEAPPILGPFNPDVEITRMQSVVSTAFEATKVPEVTGNVLEAKQKIKGAFEQGTGGPTTEAKADGGGSQVSMANEASANPAFVDFRRRKGKIGKMLDKQQMHKE